MSWRLEFEISVRELFNIGMAFVVFDILLLYARGIRISADPSVLFWISSLTVLTSSITVAVFCIALWDRHLNGHLTIQHRFGSLTTEFSSQNEDGPQNEPLSDLEEERKIALERPRFQTIQNAT
jgi:hypothetical protein